jgi:hypothetical protein
MRPWLAEIASASVRVALSLCCAVLPPMGRKSGVSSAKADAGEAPMPAIRPKTAAMLLPPRHCPNRGQWLRNCSTRARSRSDAEVVSAMLEIKAAATMTNPGE